MANTSKMTKRDYFNTLLTMPDVQANPAVVAFIEHEVELLDRKNSADKKPTAQQVANKVIADAIIAGMERDKLYTVTDLIKTIPACAELTNQRVSAILRGMTDSIERVEEKRKAYFRLA